MPNHVRNIIVIEADKAKITEILDAIKNDEEGIGSIDFNKLIPMPETLNIECGSSTLKGLEMFSDMRGKYEKLMQILNTTPDSEKFMFAVKLKKKLEKEIKDMSEEDRKLFDLGKRAFENIQNYGAPTWYEWSVDNWGTKWNAYDFDYDKDKTIYFNTAWSAPHNILQALSEKYPEVQLEHSWADEDIGYNVGERIYQGGETAYENIPAGGSKEAMDMAFSVRECSPEDYGLVLNSAGTEFIEAESETQALLPSSEDEEFEM